MAKTNRVFFCQLSVGCWKDRRSDKLLSHEKTTTQPTTATSQTTMGRQCGSGACLTVVLHHCLIVTGQKSTDDMYRDLIYRLIQHYRFMLHYVSDRGEQPLYRLQYAKCLLCIQNDKAVCFKNFF